MSLGQYLAIHAQDPQQRSIAQAVRIIREGGVIVYPTDSAYALGCHMGDKDALERIRQIRQLDKNHHFTLVCRDLKELSHYAQVDNPTFRMLKSLTPGAFTFILPATRDVPKRLLHPKRKTIGLRIPDNKIAQALLTELGEPLMSSSLIFPEAENPELSAYDIWEKLEKLVDLVIDGGTCGLEPTTVIDATTWPPTLIRQGKGDASEYC